MESTAKKSRRKDKKKVRINVALCRYEVVRKIARDRGWVLVSDEDDRSALAACNVHWIDVPDFQGTFRLLQPFAKVNHFPGMTHLARKSKLARNFERMKKLFPEEYDFCPRTWILPFDLYDFQQQFNADGMSQRTFIVKPDHSCQGRGVFLTRNLSQISRQDIMVAQQYVKAPLLIDGKKFDLRIYVLITSCEPLRVFLFKDGLVRMATADYVTPNAENMELRYMHLTNYAVNKHSNNFEVNRNATEDGSGSKRSLRWFFSWLRQSHTDDVVDALWEKIGDICLKAILAVQPMLVQEYRSTFAKNLRKVSSAPPGPHEAAVPGGVPQRPYSAQEPAREEDLSSAVGPGSTSSSFSILGMDVLVDEGLKPWLLEVNHLPSFGCDSPLDWNIKERLISQTFDILKISPDDKERYEVEMARSTQQRLYGAVTTDNAEQAEASNNRPKKDGAAPDDEANEGRPELEDTINHTALPPDVLRQTLVAFYRTFNVDRLKDLDKIMDKYLHAQDELNRSLMLKYGKGLQDFAHTAVSFSSTSSAPVSSENDEDHTGGADGEALIDFERLYPPPGPAVFDNKYRRILEASQQHMNEQQMRFSAPLQHRRADDSLSPSKGAALPPVKGAVKREQLGRDCFGFIGTDKAKWMAAALSERDKKPLVAPSPEQIAAAHRLMLGHSSQKTSVKPPTPPEQLPRARRESVNYGLQYRERLASLKHKPTVPMVQITFGSFN
ncbi:hypothetical protein P43SY_005288 [Pythium insidiosum]|uniref:Tubulin polyglutamylase n=1 Tax=Pythium insidiosum TaxID=114742 RepID=A0AAD5Q9K6_PYTIN|nr:hypothetical protein P43SY_005288 [Pythium insidiosum]